MLNRIILIGRLTKDPEIRYTQSGIAVAKIGLAVDRRRKNAKGEKETDFIDIVAWRKLAENCDNFLRKGKLISVEGRLQMRKYEAADGSKRIAAEVVADEIRFLSPKNEGNGSPQHSASFSGDPGEPLGGLSDDLPDGELPLSDDDLPF
jgi:single-strand DNA-binding protein